tara:strand:+ start:416 stop:2023 length:1608 start_codon:yes stop_codon:yes gene_type:complete
MKSHSSSFSPRVGVWVKSNIENDGVIMTNELSSSIENLTTYLKVRTITQTQRKEIKVDGVPLMGNGAPTKVFNQFFATNKRDLEKIQEGLVFESDAVIRDVLAKILPDVSLALKRELNERNGVVSPNSSIPAHLEYYYSLIPFRDLEDPKAGSIMIDTKTNRITEVEEASWIKQVGPDFVKESFPDRKGGRIEYNPRSFIPFRVVGDTGREEVIFNRFNPPAFLMEGYDDTSKLDPLFIRFIDTFFGNEESRQYTIDWIYHSLFKKMEPYLMFVGIGGTGKNLLMEACRELHGRTNFEKAAPSCLFKEFNSHLPNCTMVIYDEVDFSQKSGRGSSAKNRLKEWRNDRVPIERKGQNAKTTDIYCSGILATNNDSDVHLEVTDRKFSPVELTEVRMINKFEESEITQLWKCIYDESFQASFFNWLEENKQSDFDAHKEYKGEKFYKLVVTSLPVWAREIRSRVLEGNNSYLALSNLKDEIPTLPNIDRIQEFLLSYLEVDTVLGELVPYEGRHAIKINSSYLKQELKDFKPKKDLE